MSASQSSPPEVIRYGFWMIVIAMMLVVVAFVFATYAFKEKASDVVAVLGAVTTFIGTIVGAYFGVNVGQQGKSQLENELNIAREDLAKLSGN